MADNFVANPGVGGATFASDDIGGVQFPRTKLVIGADGVNDGDVSASNPMPVAMASLPLPAGAATETTLAALNAKLPGQGQQLMANSQPVVIASNQTAVPVSVASLANAQGSTTTGQTGPLVLGAVTTAAPTYTTGQSSPLSLDTAGGLRVAAHPVTQSGTWNVTVNAAIAAGTNAIGDVGLQVRANATGAASIHHVVSAATTNVAQIKATAGRVMGWQLANTTATWQYVKLHNVATATAGAGVVMTIGLPPNGKAECHIAQGIGFSTAISRSIVTGAADADATATTVAAVVGDIFFA